MVQGKFTPNLGEWNWMGCKEKKDKESAQTTNKLCVKKRRKRKQSKKMCADVIRSKANESEKLVSKLIVLKRSLG